MAVTKVEFKAAETVYGPWISVKRLDQEDLSKEAQSFTNKAYQYLEISRNQNLKDSIFVERVVSFKVEKAWLDSNKVDKYNVALFRYADNKWTELTTAYDQEDSGYVYYTASTPGFSYFLVGQKAAATAAPAAKTETPLTPPPPAAAETAPETAAETTAATEETATKMPFWLWIVAIIAIIAIIVGLVLWKKK
jgi:PGF-pre-PGF domain-containing protein